MRDIRTVAEVIAATVLWMIALAGLAGAPSEDAPVVWYIIILLGSKVAGAVAGYWAYRLTEHCARVLKESN